MDVFVPYLCPLATEKWWSKTHRQAARTNGESDGSLEYLLPSPQVAPSYTDEDMNNGHLMETRRKNTHARTHQILSIFVVLFYIISSYGIRNIFHLVHIIYYIKDCAGLTNSSSRYVVHYLSSALYCLLSSLNNIFFLLLPATVISEVRIYI